MEPLPRKGDKGWDRVKTLKDGLRVASEGSIGQLWNWKEAGVLTAARPGDWLRRPPEARGLEG